MIFHDGRIVLHEGDCADVIKTLAADSVYAVVTDPPYALAFMGKKWDSGDVAFSPIFWADVLRALKPGGHLLAFGGTRTYHRLACAIEDAGFEIRDQIQWIYGQGFPKSHTLKPANEPIVLARRPLSEATVAANVLRWETGALNIDGCRIDGGLRPGRSSKESKSGLSGTSGVYGSFAVRGSIAIEDTALGRWPANVVHDGSDEVLDLFPESSVTGIRKKPDRAPVAPASTPFTRGKNAPEYTDSGSTARFFYSAKASKAERCGSKHPTIKPIALMRWLMRLVTPPGGLVLDPFAGSGTTGEAAFREGFRAVLIEREAEYQADIIRRLSGLSLAPTSSHKCP
jgi:site-specific DNA-methyltransferase (adenine-specific)